MDAAHYAASHPCGIDDCVEACVFERQGLKEGIFVFLLLARHAVHARSCIALREVHAALHNACTQQQMRPMHVQRRSRAVQWVLHRGQDLCFLVGHQQAEYCVLQYSMARPMPPLQTICPRQLVAEVIRKAVMGRQCAIIRRGWQQIACRRKGCIFQLETVCIFDAGRPRLDHRA